MGSPRPAGVSSGVRRVVLDAAGVGLSALLSEPAGTPRATVVALHGAGMTAGYFDGQAHPDVSLLRLGACLGYTVLAVDRPGYGQSAGEFPDGASLAEQAALLAAALARFGREHATGAGLLVLAHSYGGKLALAAASGCEPAGLLGLDISGCGHEYAASPPGRAAAHEAAARRLNWGPLSLYPPGTFRACAGVVAPMPAREADEARHWPEAFPRVAAGVRVPVRLTFAEHESWWRHDARAIAGMAAQLPAPRVAVCRQPGAGHNISLGWSARPYHLRALAFLEECLRPGT